jgi:ribonuclease T2
MDQSSKSRLISRLAAAAALLVVALGPVSAQDKRQNEPGQFDFYVLALSWSPSFCDAATERSPERTGPQEQCGERPFSFVVHGLWPQYERGFPEYCQREAARLDRNIVSSMLDLMPSPRLIFNQWQKHGTCAGLPPRGYFDSVRKARALVKIPSPYIDVKNMLTVSPAEVEEAFLKANPGMSPASIAVTCDSKRLQEVRVCLSKDFRFRDCPDVDRRACRRDQVVMPPVRGS